MVVASFYLTRQHEGPIYLVLEAGPPMPPVGGRLPAITSSMATLTMYGYWHLKPSTMKILFARFEREGGSFKT
jgi:hypothetical protein